MPRRTATLEDVARAAGVSQQTVSRVLNRPEVVSARTREQVIRAMHSGGKRSDGARRAQRAGPAQSQRQPGGIGDRLR